MAAQTSRDRKKAKMDEMDITIKSLIDENDELKSKYSCLTVEHQKLMRQNMALERQLEELKKRLDVDQEFDVTTPTLKTEAMDTESINGRWMGCGIDTFEGSAVSDINPLPKGTTSKPQSIRRPLVDENLHSNGQKSRGLQASNKRLAPMRKETAACDTSSSHSSNSSNSNASSDSAALWKIIALCLLYRTCSKISMQPDWRSLPKVYSQMSPQTLKLMLEEAATHLPKLKATQSQCLDQWWGPKQKTWNPAKISMEA